MRINHLPTLRASGFAQSTVRFAVLFVVLSLLAVPVFAQTSARLEGTIQDPTGAVVPNAKITAVNVKTQDSSSTTSSTQGLFTIPALPPGVYTVTVEAAGFQKQIVKNLELNVGANVAQIFKLKVGQAIDSVVVEANAVAVQTNDSQLGSAITMRDIDTLPQLARTPISLAVFQPGVQINAGDVSFSHVNGMRGGSNNSTLDGIDVNDSLVPRLGLSLTANNTDSVQEFKVVTEGGKAEFGRSAGAQVELITRPGTNNFHGNAFDYLRNTKLNANDYFNNQLAAPLNVRPKFIQNIYGGSFGGPIMHDKTFIFGNFQGRRTAQQTVRNRTVLSPNAKAGLFTYVQGGVTKTFNIITADPRGKGIDPAVAATLARLPAPNNTNAVGSDGLNTMGYQFNNPSGSYEDQFTIRGDHNINKNNKAFLRWSWQRNSSIDALNNADATFPGEKTGTQGGKRWGYSIGDDWTFGNSWANEFRFGHQSAQVVFARARLAGPTIISNDFTDPDFSGFAQGRNSPVNDIIDNVTKVHNSHTFKFGVKLSYTLQTGFNDAGIYPNIFETTGSGNTPVIPGNPAGLTTTQQTNLNNLYNELLGRISSVTLTFLSSDLTSFQAPGTTRQRDYTIKESAYYFQDDWRIRRNLTLNLGVRYEYFGVPTEQNGKQASLTGAEAFDGVNLITNGTFSKSNAWYKADRNNIAPRVGFAWDIFGDGKTALRGNYGVFYDRNIGATVNQVDGNTPGFSSGGLVTPQTIAPPAGVPAGDVRISDGIPIPLTPAAPLLTLPVAGRTTTIAIINPNLRTGYVNSWALSLQREIAKNTVLDVGYVGNRGIKLFMAQDFNQLKTGGSFLTAFQELQAYNASAAAVPSATNPIVKMFTNVPVATCASGSATVVQASNCAISKIGASNVTNGNIGSAANTLDQSFNSLYAAAGLPQTFIRNYPQYNNVQVGGNGGRSYYDALQVGIRRSTGALRATGNYTYSHSIDNITVDPNGFTSPIDNYNLARNRGNGDFDQRHSFNASVSYSLPFGKGQRWGSNMPRWLDSIAGGWDVGSLILLQDGKLFTVSSTRTTFANNVNTRANYSGDYHAGSVQYQPDGSVFFFTPADFANFSFPVAGSIGNTGRNQFRGPHFTNVDASLVKKVKITEKQWVTFRAEAYNVFNHANFGGMSTSLTSPASFGKFSSTLGSSGGGTGARTMQLTLRYDF